MKTQEKSIKVGDFVNAYYKFGIASGRVVKVFKNHVIISKYQPNFNTYTDLKVELNITISRIYDINNPEYTYN